MGWLFACFGYTKKRKRPTRPSKLGPKIRRIRSYQPLECSDADLHDRVHHELSASDSVTTSNLELRTEPKAEKKARIRKKVRFNLEVIAYEPLPTEADDASSSNSQDDVIDNKWAETEEDNKEEEEEDEQAAEKVNLVYATLSKPSLSLSSIHRYSNCYEHDDDDVECELSDLDDNNEDDDSDDYDWLIDPRKIYNEGTMNSSEADGSTRNARFRSHYVVPVLNPIENLSQWRALKGRKF